MALKYRSLLAMLPAAVILGGTARAQDVPSDVKPDHWAYAAVEDLAKKGLIKGYPPDGKFLGGRSLSRYEMATIIKRILDRMDDIVKQAKPAPGVSQEDFDKLKSSVGEIQQLANEFKTQLTVIGADMSKVKDDLTALKAQLGELSTKVDSFDSRINSLSSKVDETKILADQAIVGENELRDALNSGLSKKVDVGTGKLRIGATIHIWALTPFGGTANGNNPTNFSSAGPGRSFGGGVGDTFRIKRAEVYFTGQVFPGASNKPGQADYFVLLDTGKTINASATSTPQPNSTFLQDAFVGYQLGSRWRFEAGQQKTDMDVEGSRSSAALWTIERSIMNLLPVYAGRVGYVRDVGAMMRYRSSQGSAMLGVFNGNGDGQGTVAPTRQKFASFNAYYTGVRHLTLGIWGGENFGDSTPAEKKEREGASLIYQNGQHVFEAEGAYTRDVSPALPSPNAGASSAGGSYGRGGYILYGYTVTKKFQMVGRFDVWDPAFHGASALVNSSITVPRNFHDLREWTIGLNYYVNGKKPDGTFDQRFKIQLNYIIDAVEKNGVAFWGKSRNLLITNFQTAF